MEQSAEPPGNRFLAAPWPAFEPLRLPPLSLGLWTAAGS